MKKLRKFLALFTGFLMLFSMGGLAQSGHHPNGHFDPDSLILVTVTGTAIIDSSMLHPVYYLDDNGDTQPDYHLNFGPFWYQPDSSDAVRPQHGDVITITGGLHDMLVGNFPVIVVYEINGDFWRDPYNGFWNQLGHHSHTGGHHQGGCQGSAFGWMHDSLETVSLSGLALVDTTFVMAHYYLDTDNNGEPDYFLNFGPPWYEPTSGATRPNNGDQIDITGGSVDSLVLPMVIVYEINGLLWRDSTNIGSHFGGHWIHRNMGQPQNNNAPFDPDDHMQFNPGWHPGGMMMPDSLFCQILEVYPQNIPNTGNMHVFSGYEIGIFEPNGENGMWGHGGCGGHMNFASNIHFKLHYNDIQLQGNNIDENTIQAKYWDRQSNSWISASNSVIDPINNTVTFIQSDVRNFVVLTGTQNLVALESPATSIPGEFDLKQNYPNPFNPGTTIEFELVKNAQVVLTIYNSLGQRLFDLINAPFTPGNHRINFDGRTLPSGIYFYELKVGEQSRVMRMNLIK
ncbi:MAG: T9SS type A sorting domain-containing protein [Calditrichaeota bacterium]|nr:T9SS type A sorting domain-containing protein [Calditrichota bacterium]